ncbi:DUF6117 family protein [Asticcacaulis taihuensis]|uniref:DUF6117 family protein n=1 Tax=Asticcacaulis taihuensis TaxID=260084 RepID=UPI0026EF7D69|nr:DUF6117 family protein [Asticcacaulis taihuensis]
MSIPEPIRANFQTLLRAAEQGDLALLECADADTGEPRYVICAVQTGGGEYLFTPFGHLVSDRNPYEAYIPPDAGPDAPDNAPAGHAPNDLA